MRKTHTTIIHTRHPDHVPLSGELGNAKPHRCSELARHDLDDLPGGAVSRIRAALLACGKGITFGLDSWK